MPWLKEDIRSLVHPDKIYARKGEQVVLVKDCITALIVRTTPGNYRFAIEPKDLTDEPPEKWADGIPPVEAPPPSAIRRPKRTKPAAGRGATDPSAQSSLF